MKAFMTAALAVIIFIAFGQGRLVAQSEPAELERIMKAWEGRIARSKEFVYEYTISGIYTDHPHKPPLKSWPVLKEPVVL